MKINILTSLGSYGYIKAQEPDYIQFYYNLDNQIEKGKIYINNNSFYVCIGNIKAPRETIKSIELNKRDKENLKILINTFSPYSTTIAPLSNLEKLDIEGFKFSIKEDLIK